MVAAGEGAPRRRGRGIGLVAISAVGYGLMPIFIRLAYDDGAQPFPLLAVRFACAAIFLLLLIVASGRAPALRVPRRTLRKLVLLGAGGFGGTALTLYLAIHRMAPSLVELVYFTYPGMVLVLAAWLKGEAIGRVKVASLACMAIGVLLVAGAGAGDPNAAGMSLSLACAAIYAFYVVFINDAEVQAAGAAVVSFYVTACCAAVFSLATLAGSDRALAHGPKGHLALLAIILLSTVVPIFCFVRGARELEASETALIACLEPAVTVLADAVILGRRFGADSLAGILLLGAGLFIMNGRRKPDLARAGVASSE
jgi:drug/metabolite transporter (DMT)-like permease